MIFRELKNERKSNSSLQRPSDHTRERFGVCKQTFKQKRAHKKKKNDYTTQNKFRLSCRN